MPDTQDEPDWMGWDKIRNVEPMKLGQGSGYNINKPALRKRVEEAKQRALKAKEEK